MDIDEQHREPYFVVGDYVCPSAVWGYGLRCQTFGAQCCDVFKVTKVIEYDDDVNHTPLVGFDEFPGRQFGQNWFDHVTAEGKLIATAPALTRVGWEELGRVKP